MTANRHPRPTGFTIMELLVVVSIIALLAAILLPAIAKARDAAKLTQSLSNLKQLGIAHGSYAAEWNDRQLTLVEDTIARHGTWVEPAFNGFTHSHGGYQHPGPVLGWGRIHGDGPYVLFKYRCDGNMANASLTIPINFTNATNTEYFGSFRLINVRQFNQYVSGRFFDPIFYAPKDTIVLNDVDGGASGYSCFDDPGEYCDRPPIADFGEGPTWSSYVLSPAAMFAPAIFAQPEDGGWVNPWHRPAGMRSPAMGMAVYPSLKTHMVEHHWLQARRAECNPAFTPGTYGGCEPFYFNHALESTPATLFYDGHVETVGVEEAERADATVFGQTGGDEYLWCRDTQFGVNGYFIDAGYDEAGTSYHILTAEGIRGRDFVAR